VSRDEKALKTLD